MSEQTVTAKSLTQHLWVLEVGERTPTKQVLALTEVKAWMNSDDIEVLGVVDTVIHDGRFRIEPPLSVTDYVLWVKHYYGRCFRENPDGEWSDSSYSAGWHFVGIFINLWDDETVPRQVLLDLKDWVASVYKDGDLRLRECVVNASLEHLFERQPIREYFSDWQDDSTLAPAYEQACLWDGRTPLSR